MSSFFSRFTSWRPGPFSFRFPHGSFLVFLLVFPWLSPFIVGPFPQVLQWLVSMLCVTWIFSFRNEIDAVLIARCWVIGAFIATLIALIQYFGISSVFWPFVYVVEVGGAPSNLGQRNHFATLTSIGLLALIWYSHQPLLGVWVSQDGWCDAFSAHCALLLPMSLLALGNAASGSRTGFSQWVLIVGLSVVWAIHHRQWRRIQVPLLAFVLYVAASQVLPWILHLATGANSVAALARFDESTAGCFSRSYLWSNVAHLISMKPWLGWGVTGIGYAHFMTDYPGVRYCDAMDNAHNLPLQLAFSLGIPFAILVCGGLGWFILQQRPWLERNSVRQLAWGVLAVIGLHSLLEYPLWYGPFQIAVGLCVWLLWTTPCANKSSKESSQDVLLRASGNSAQPGSQSHFYAILVTSVLLFVAIQYIQLTAFSEAITEPGRHKPTQPPTVFFSNEVAFYELRATYLSMSNAATVNASARALLLVAPTSDVLERLIESAYLLNHQDEARFFFRRYKINYPQYFQQWEL